MNRVVSPALLVGGIILIAIGMSTTDSLGSDVSNKFFITGSLTDGGIWMLDGGIAAALAGLTMLRRVPKPG